MTNSTTFSNDLAPESDNPRPRGRFQRRSTLTPAEPAEPSQATEATTHGRPGETGFAAELLASRAATAETANDEAAGDAHPTTTGPADAPAFWPTMVSTLGLCLLSLGVVLLAAWPAGNLGTRLRPMLQNVGLTPVDVVMVGLLLIGIAQVRKWMLRDRLDLRFLMDSAELSSAAADQARAQLNSLVEANSRTKDELQSALQVLKRQDEKLGQLSAATKSFGKPLQDITTQMSESGQHVAELGSTLQAVKIILEQSSSRLEQALRTDVRKPEGAPVAGDFAEAVKSMRETMRTIETLQRDLATRLTQKTDKLTTDLLAAANQTLQQLGVVRTELNQTLTTRSDKLAAEVAQLDRRVEQSRAAVLAGMKQLVTQPGQAGSPELAEALQRIQLELNQLVADVAVLRTDPGAARGRSSSDAATATEQPATSAAAPEIPESPVGTKPTANPTNVKSAIAKLKSLRK